MNHYLGNIEKSAARLLKASYNDDTIRVYQAYNSKIAEEALELNTFGSSFNKERMTWIKPSFLWMMYRSDWGMKLNQERILAVDLSRKGFDEILAKSISTTFDYNSFSLYKDWKMELDNSEVRCQWDPDRDFYGQPIDRRAIQLGIKGSLVENYVNDWIFHITDITTQVHTWHQEINLGDFCIDKLPLEIEYPIDNKLMEKLGIKN